MTPRTPGPLDLGSPDHRLHDQIQAEATLQACIVCRRRFYMTHPHEICWGCRREREREQAQEVRRGREETTP
jgi:hypothetical protein